MKGNKVLEVALGVVTSIGGFLDAGTLATAAQAGAAFRFQLLWVLVLGTVCTIFLIEMSGRLAAVSHHPLSAAVRERFGFDFFVIPLIAGMFVDFLLLSAEIGGAAYAVQLVTGIGFRWWVMPVALAAWYVLWNFKFKAIENGVSALGMVTLAFVVAAVWLRPEPIDVVRGLIPSLPHEDKPHYWFIAVSILGSLISPFLFNFYSSGAIEDKWDEQDLGVNRAVAILGMGFGCMIAAGVLITAAVVLHPHHVEVSSYEQAALILTEPWGKAGFYLFAGGLFISCFGAIVEVSLDSSYVLSQALGWNWGESPKPIDATRFSTVYTVMIFASGLLMLTGIEPLKLTLFVMALTALILPVIVLPFLVLMNDATFVGKHKNGRIGNYVVFGIILLAFILAVAAIPLEIFGS